MERNEKAFWLFVVSAVLVTNYLFYIDEGYCDFRWMKEWGNWIVFALFVLVMTVCQFVAYLILTRLIKARWAVIAVLILFIWCVIMVF